ncbi:hypothetical protein H2Y56_22150 [Pectobacterium aroidearum]|uniref:Phage protein n=2 Tax=Pectobacterium aroidearum TaxID=1201031 RepID=A0ABR5ZJM3_9GAMM|nr:hypothetical protein [Pectobacterium aroidearum]MBA5739966.1 hypothetical protein [Pectobacterium aroidearum]
MSWKLKRVGSFNRITHRMPKGPIMSKCRTRDTMSSVVIAATERMLSETGESCAHFATERLIPALEIQNLISTGSDGVTAESYTRWRSRSIKQTERVMTGDVRMPADWVITWISVLTDPYRNDCNIKIAAMQGLVHVRIPQYNVRNVRSVEAELDAITVQFGHVLANAEPAHDGFYDSNDCTTALQRLQNRLFELVTFVRQEITNIESATGIAPDAVALSRISPLNGVH